MTETEHTDAEISTPKVSAGYKIILLDDDKFLLDMYSMKFSQEGYVVQSCLSVDEVLASLRGGFAADAVIFDLVMPENDGFDLLRAIKEELLVPKAALIALTNQGEDEERDKIEDLGAHEYIVKAMTVPSEVVKKVTETIAKRK